MIPGPTRTPTTRPPGTEITPVHERISRRLRGLPAECGPLADRNRKMTGRNTGVVDAPPPPTPSIQYVVHQPRTPKIFYGESFEDVEDWLEQFERVAAFNEWNEERKLHNVYYALEEGARTWFENYEAKMTSWEEFRRRILAAYVTGDRKETAEAALQARSQRPNESVTTYAEDMSRLFRRADPDMAEDKKVRHLMRGVKEEIFAGLVRNPPLTVSEFIKEATAIERALRQRARQYHREGATVSNVAQLGMPGLREIVRQIVREELHRLQLGNVSPASVSIAEIVREEISQAVRTSEQADMARQEPRISYAATLRNPAYCSPPAIVPVSPQPKVHLGPRDVPYQMDVTPRKSDVWRAPDRRPLCFHCGEAGHVYRTCAYRRAGLRGFSPNAPCPKYGERPREIEEYIAGRQNMFPPIRRESRSPSPPIRRRSLSPRVAPGSTSRRPGSPENRGN